MYSAGRLFCPRCYSMQEFVCEAMPRPGSYPACECYVCSYEFGEGVIDDKTRAEAVEQMRAERVQNAPGGRRR